ncbi:DUF4097 family beta strand repeat-containing protein [Amycolatopsis pithecellobii]|uniref:DUF4097 family beta strand repeat protein n=1 Tax=Amycolatopsis pithecellobii TaxID=664692 RepID=A0A6N7Z6Q5_9PSEU|nr:DUF4097 family beta strand repeat-containing protein [Amycolatopsis pithecellobii]MTD57649.1 DUF4097 family beta strand repeat protein [Amycolatopsis pithecellobii]
MGRPALALGGVALIGAGVAVALGWWWPQTAEAHELVPGVQSVRLDVSSGDVRVRAGDAGSTSVVERFRYSGSRPDHAYRLDSGQLVLADCGHDCSVDYEIVVPRGTSVTGNANSGDIELAGVSADVSNRSGQIDVRDATGPVKVHTNSGDISVSLSSPQDVTAQASSGDVDLTVPDERYRIDARTSSGDRKIEIPADPTGLHLLDLQASSGDITVRHSY